MREKVSFFATSRIQKKKKKTCEAVIRSPATDRQPFAPDWADWSILIVAVR